MEYCLLPDPQCAGSCAAHVVPRTPWDMMIKISGVETFHRQLRAPRHRFSSNIMLDAYGKPVLPTLGSRRCGSAEVGASTAFRSPGRPGAEDATCPASRRALASTTGPGAAPSERIRSETTRRHRSPTASSGRAGLGRADAPGELRQSCGGDGGGPWKGTPSAKEFHEGFIDHRSSLPAHGDGDHENDRRRSRPLLAGTDDKTRLRPSRPRSDDMRPPYPRGVARRRGGRPGRVDRE